MHFPQPFLRIEPKISIWQDSFREYSKSLKKTVKSKRLAIPRDITFGVKKLGVAAHAKSFSKPFLSFKPKTQI